MARERRSEVVVSGACAIAVAPGSALTPARWAGKEARLARMDRLCALALVACDGALLDGALTPTAPEWDGDRTAIVFGSAYGCHATNEDYYRGLVRDGQLGASPRLFAYTLPSSPVGEISIHYGVRGPATAWCNGLTSGLDAFAEGVALVERGRADRVLVCAAEVATPLLARILAGNGPSLYGEAPLVDASAALLLERADAAAARGATPRGRLLAVDSAFHAGSRSAAVADAVARTLATADLPPGAFRRILATPADAAAARQAGIRGRLGVAGEDRAAITTSESPAASADGARRLERPTNDLSAGEPSTALGTPSTALGTPSTALGTPSTALGTPSTTLGTPTVLGEPSTALGEEGTAIEPGALGAAPLIAAARFFASAAQGTLALACAGDDGGAATAAVLLAG
jgi:3-oxoacyl-[acyl-carrier-protein] synthase II